MTDKIIDQTLETFKLMLPGIADEGQTMNLAKIEQTLRPVPDAQIDITILTDGKCIAEKTLDVFAEYDNGDSSVGESEGWLIHRVMLGKTDVTTEMDLIEIQQYLGEIL